MRRNCPVRMQKGKEWKNNEIFRADNNQMWAVDRKFIWRGFIKVTSIALHII